VSYRLGVRRATWLAFAIAIPVAAGLAGGRLGAVFGAILAVVVALWLRFWLPRSAHGAFDAGLHARAARRYRILHAVATSDARERAAQLSRIACEIARGSIDRAEAMLARIDPAALDAAERAVWLNNRACAMLADARDPHAALALIDEASALRPDVPALQHTRGMALLAVGRIDEAIGVLDGMRAGGELPPRLEAERCRDLATAWARKGEVAYAEDYRLRAAGLAR